ncbi:BDNF/NT-3 growth factors receptor-like [Patiria miniata]|uniref:receptor protein-tyrosine kinase n=1 Tax=Patiria miniata TaxID=46514 RepID=A0A914B7W9_PATMI|nr:BDNF/NT-3 growth factors receptor-like [Patiria miniata]
MLGTTRIRTTAYHPSANGLVERLHRQLKASLKAHSNQQWTETLPLVLLGIRTAVKADLGCSAVELVLGTTIRLPGQFVETAKPDRDLDPSNYVHRLKRLMQDTRPSPTRTRLRKSQIHPELATCTHVFVRHDAVRKPLQPPYDGPFRVLKRADKYFVLELNGRRDTVGIDRLKVAYSDKDMVTAPDHNPPIVIDKPIAKPTRPPVPDTSVASPKLPISPVVTSLKYRDGIITCDADANPFQHIEYNLILNGTKPSAPTGKTLAFNVDDNNCTEVSCNVTNAIGTGSRKLEEPLCPVVPVVTSLTYRNGIITCDADGNPLRHIEYYIILNGTKPSAPTGKTLAFYVDDNYCTEVSCNVTNAIGTGSRQLEEPLCPVLLRTTGVSESTSTRPTDASKRSGSSLVGIIVVSVVAVIVIVAVVGGLAFVVWRRRHKQQRTETGVKDDLNDVASQGADSELPPLPVTDQSSPGLDPHHPNDIPLEPIASAVVCESISIEDGVEASNDVAYGNVGPELSFSRDLVVIENELGRGEFGRVLLGKALGIEEAGKETKVAVKTVKEGADKHAKNELVAELQVMKTVGSHPNVVKLLGYCAEKDPVYVIVEYLAKGDLKKVLSEYREKDPGAEYSNLPGVSKSLARTLVKFARDVANGMAYISSQKYVHRDLAARNVLVGDDLVCKVSDFGLARDVMNTLIYQRQSQGPLPMRWMALESILVDVYTTKSDVWSFGILLWEIVTLGARPYPLLTATTMISKLQQGYRMPKPRQCKKTLYKMMCSCWKEVPKERPSFQSLYQQLDDMVSEDQDYINMGNLDKRIYEVKIVERTKEKL